MTDQYYVSRLKSGEKSIQTLQDRLDNAVKHLSNAITRNKELRTEIDHLLKER